MEILSRDESTQTVHGLCAPKISRIVDCKTVHGQRFYKVKWETSWEPEDSLSSYKALVDAYWSFVNRLTVEQNKLQVVRGPHRQGNPDVGKSEHFTAGDSAHDGAVTAPALSHGRIMRSNGGNYSSQVASPSDILGIMAASQSSVYPHNLFGSSQFGHLQAMLNSPPVLYMIAQALGMAPNASNPIANSGNISAHNTFLNVYGLNSVANTQHSDSPNFPHLGVRSFPHSYAVSTPLCPPMQTQIPQSAQPMPMHTAAETDEDADNTVELDLQKDCHNSISKLNHQSSSPSFKLEAISPSSRESTSRDSDKMEAFGHISSPGALELKVKANKMLKPAKEDEKECISNPGLHRVKNFDNPYAKVVFLCKICKEELHPSPISKWKEHSFLHMPASDSSQSVTEDFMNELEKAEWESIWYLPMDASAALGVEGIRYMESFKNPYVDLLLVCKICKKEQEPKYSRNWKMHFLSHLPNEERPHRCPVCGDGYVRPDRLRRHIQQQHPEEASKSIGEQHTPISIADEASLPEYESFMAIQQHYNIVPSDELVPDEKDDSKTWVKL